MALSFTTLCQPTVLKEWQKKNNERDSASESFMCSASTQHYSDGSLAVRRRPWRTRQRRSLKIDFRIPGIPQAAVEQEDKRARGIQRLAHMIKMHSNHSVSVKDLQKTDAYNHFSEESKKVIHNLGHVEYSEMYEISSKYWAEGIVKTNRVYETIDRREIRHLIHPVVCC